MFFEFPDDEKCWELPEQYMFGSDYLVAPVLELGARERSVYLPKGQWESISDKKIYSGGQTVTVPDLLMLCLYLRRSDKLSIGLKISLN